MNVIWTLVKAVIFGTGLWVWGLIAKDTINEAVEKSEGPIVRPISLMK